ncbi:hypothetical protein CVT24_003435 [Panaeolus cyanescens]|uniref:Uncharacterized protein n=1 Tax=Panaeolus cyanescens TaxID=181874 RepID=A0A409Y6Q5_9AGAR|nr:hypothetical protein CVT24_003435 [Panaeolus cyanescens]
MMNKDLFAWHLHRRGPNFIDRLDELMKYTTHLAYIVDHIDTDGDSIRLMKLIQCAPNIQDLAIWHGQALRKVHDAVIKLSNLKRLSAFFFGLREEQILSPAYLGITHLELLDGFEPRLISYFQNLTHLCLYLPNGPWREIFVHATDKDEGCRSLRVLIGICEGFDEDDSEEMNYSYPDQRYVALPEGMDYQCDWMEGVEGNIDFWEFAERIVIAREKNYLLMSSKARLSGKLIDESSFFIEDHLTEEGQSWWIGKCTGARFARLSGKLIDESSFFIEDHLTEEGQSWWIGKCTGARFLTARRFYNWSAPFIFRVMDKDLFAWHLHRRGPNFIDRLSQMMKYTTHLSYTVDSDSDPIRLKKLIECAPNIQDLAIWHYEALWEVHDAVMKLSNLKRLSGFFCGLREDQILSPTYLGITHLELLDGIEPRLISFFQNLTHLCLYLPSGQWRKTFDQATDKEEGCLSLRVLIGIRELDDDIDETQEIDCSYPDQRYVRMPGSGMDYQRDWMDGVEGNIDFWELAERIVIAREKNYLLASSKARLNEKLIDEPTFFIEDHLTEEGQLWWIQRKPNPDVPSMPHARIKYTRSKTSGLSEQ